MRLSLGKILIFGFALLFLSFAVYQICRTIAAARKTLSATRARLIEQNRVPFEKRILAPIPSQSIKILQNTDATRDLVRFRDSYYAATGGGLVELSADGKTRRHFTVLDGLPESDLTCLAVYANKLYIGTRTKNLVAFDGEVFENYAWTDRKSQTVTSLLNGGDKLLIGTLKGGLLEFDGDRFAELKAAGGARIEAIVCLSGSESELYAGTFDNGLWSYKNGVWRHWTTLDGLPSNRVVGVVASGEKLYAATDFGLAVAEADKFRSVAPAPALSSLVSHEQRLFMSRDNGEILTFVDSPPEFTASKSQGNARLVALDGKIWLLTDQGISQLKGAAPKPFGQTRIETLTDNFVSALAIDRRENLWVGTFRRGIDVFAANGRKLRHLETESLREINFLAARAEVVSAATSGGLVDLKSDFSTENVSQKEGLPSNSVTHLAGAHIATAKGLARRENNKWRLISAVQGLPNDSVYAVLEIGKTLYAGTLGGLAVIENGRVARVYKDSNSNLATNWVTALCAAQSRIFIGTYGGGIFELTPSGEIRSFEGETGKFTVNPNALYSDGEKLFAGTLGGARVLDLRTQEWKTVAKALPAETVLSVAGDEKHVYFGTTGGVARIEKSYFAEGANE
jgi:ligand-binding sensor domain-containing protein